MAATSTAIIPTFSTVSFPVQMVGKSSLTGIVTRYDAIEQEYSIRDSMGCIWVREAHDVTLVSRVTIGRGSDGFYYIYRNGVKVAYAAYDLPRTAKSALREGRA
jgi:hypothetical protein